MVEISMKTWHSSILKVQYDEFVNDVVITLSKGAKVALLDKNEVLEIAKAIGITAEDLK